MNREDELGRCITGDMLETSEKQAKNDVFLSAHGLKPSEVIKKY